VEKVVGVGEKARAGDEKVTSATSAFSLFYIGVDTPKNYSAHNSNYIPNNFS
jgi:hypothetical protein